MKALTPVFLVWLIALLLAPTNATADGMFVVPKFVWDKHKDINEPTQKAILVYDAGREDLILQVKYEGPVDEFGWLIPVPNLPTIRKGSMNCFYELSQYTQRNFGQQAGEIPMAGSLGRGDNEKPEPVKVIEVKTVGAYQIAVLSTQDSGALAKWLEVNRFYFPTNKTDALDAYVKQQWYFVAARIDLSASGGFRLLSPRQAQNELIPNYSAHLKLANGELNPLQISFASDRCVFPLKISSVNGQPSEVQVYVLSPEPLLEKSMFEEKQEELVRSDQERESKLEQSRRNLQALRVQMLEASLLPSAEAGKQLNSPPEVPAWDLLPYDAVTEKELPQCSKVIYRLKGKTWWLTKQTWTFQPTQMHDLEFQPAIPALVGKLKGTAGYFAAADLASLGTNGATALLSALDGTNSVARLNVASVLERINDPRLSGQLDRLLADPQPEVRAQAISAVMNHWNSGFTKELVGLLRDPYREIRHQTVLALERHRSEVSPYIPVFRQMLKDTNAAVRASGMEMLYQLQVPLPREQLLQFFKLPDREAISLVLAQLRNKNNSGMPAFINDGTGISDNEAIPLLRNADPLARLIGLKILYKNAEKQSVELAMLLLKDPEPAVRLRAARTLRALTGQHFTDKQADQWQKWWMANKTSFVVQVDPEELVPQPPDYRIDEITDRPRATPPENFPR